MAARGAPRGAAPVDNILVRKAWRTAPAERLKNPKEASYACNMCPLHSPLVHSDGMKTGASRTHVTHHDSVF